MIIRLITVKCVMSVHSV